MGLFFPVYPPEELDKVDKDKRHELKKAIHDTLHKDPALKKLLEDKLPEARKLLREKTLDTYRKVARR